MNLYLGSSLVLADEADAVQVRHVDVGDDQVELVNRFQRLEGLHAVDGLDRLVALLGEYERDALSHRGGIVDDQDLLGHVEFLLIIVSKVRAYRARRWTS